MHTMPQGLASLWFSVSVDARCLPPVEIGAFGRVGFLADRLRIFDHLRILTLFAALHGPLSHVLPPKKIERETRLSTKTNNKLDQCVLSNCGIVFMETTG